MQPVLESIRQLPAYTRLRKSLREKNELPGLGLQRAARLPMVATLVEDIDHPILLITDRADHALSFYDELGFWTDRARYLFGEPNPLFYEQAGWGVTTRRDRLQALTALARYYLPFVEKNERAPVLITSTRSLMTRTLPRQEYLRACKKISVEQVLQPELLLRSWARIGYQRVDTVLEAGQFSHRGGLLDIWPASEPQPVRLDFFGDEIEVIRRFDPASQRTLEKLASVLITPAREFLLPEDVDFPDISEFDIPRLHPMPASLIDYLPPNSLVCIDDLGMVAAISNEIEEQAIKLRDESIREGVLPEDYPVPYVTWSELQDSLQGHTLLELGFSTAGDFNEDSLAAQFNHDERFGGRLKPFIEYLGSLVNDDEKTIVVSRQSPRLLELWEGSRGQQEENNPVFIEASISEGFVLTNSDPLPNTHLISDSEIFGWERPRPRTRQRPVAETPETLYADLQDGDLVVHIDHGIGRFTGLVQRNLEGHEREFLSVKYEGNDTLFVPVHQADRLTRYIGADGGRPSLDRLGGHSWHETRNRVKQAVQQVAEDLLDLYARRSVVEGHAFAADSNWQKELEDSFPYVETEDQAEAIEEIKRDMERPRPMDRLLCGDVGYGKTEVALRAAFKAVMDGKQVAILVPTTVLAQQHYETFLQRLAAFPVKVEMLSRFRTQREQTAIIFSLALGEIDIVIGTHRLISGDVSFKDLGLVIIDEEQRFGVTHKEHLKKLRTEVDVLTLTATPIPRTLYMALTGVRDISNLNTPPEERLSIITHVGPYKPRLVRQAILRELERGGQVFFVHNRVQTIEAMKAHLNKLVPEARVDIGHGQMPEVQLSAVMRRFTAGEIEVLLSTSIIESGLDIPNANTLIVDRADTFGLAQLYQLRGRVGRGAMRAYAYFFRHNKFSPTVEGQQRLEVIAENTQLGAGYSIAMRDLEIRGAGDLLGTRQHGYIQAVGFHLYTRLLADAVRQLRATGSGVIPMVDRLSTFNLPLAMPVNVDLPLAVGIPADYIPDDELRLRLYRRIADLRDETEIEALVSEFSDRFGKLPDMVVNLLYQMRVKLKAERAGLTGVAWENGQIILRFPPPPDGAAPHHKPDLGSGTRSGKNAYWLTFGREPDWPARLMAALERLTQSS